MVSMKNSNNDVNIFPYNTIKHLIDTKKLDLLKLYVEKGLDVNLKNEYGESLVEYALEDYRSIPIAFYLIKCGADPQPILDDPLSDMLIIHDGDLDLLKSVIAHGREINLQDSLGNTLLSLAIHEGKLDMIEYLIKNGANLNLISWEGSYSNINKLCHYTNNKTVYYKIETFLRKYNQEYNK